MFLRGVGYYLIQSLIKSKDEREDIGNWGERRKNEITKRIDVKLELGNRARVLERTKNLLHLKRD